MERNEWNNRTGYGDGRYRNRSEQERADEDSYRGAYRLDITSDHRNQSTWDGFGPQSDRSRRRGTDYNQDFNRNYNYDFNRNYNSDQRRDRGGSAGEDNPSRDSRARDRSRNGPSWDEHYHPTSGGYGARSGARGGNRQDRDPYGSGNFESDYRRDNYGSGGGANYGNMAGSLSYGYDGDYNSDPDWNRRYDPMSGHRRSYHGNYESRHPESGQYRNNPTRSGNKDSGWF